MANNLKANFIKAVKERVTQTPAFQPLPRQMAYEEKYAYPLRKSTIVPMVRLVSSFLAAVRMLTCADKPKLPCEKNFVAIRKGNLVLLEAESSVSNLRYFITADGASVRGSVFSESDNTSHYATEFTSTPEFVTYILLALMPKILETDKKQASGKLGEVISELGNELATADSWTSENDIPELTREHLYYLDGVLNVLEALPLDFGDANSSIMSEPSFTLSEAARTGAVFASRMEDGWSPLLVIPNGRTELRMNSAATIGNMKVEYANVFAHRSWTPMEQMLIPQFPDDMPVATEVVRLAKRIASTRNSKNPVVNAMWRSETGYGKSTGIKMLACILNIPYLSITCHPGMEVQEFKSNFVPVTDGYEPESQRTAPEAGNDKRLSFFEEAVAYVSALPANEQEALFDAPAFFANAMAEDPAVLMAKLIGREQEISFEEICTLYASVRAEVQTERKLRIEIARLKSQSSDTSRGSAPQFHHVLSNYVKAMVNGYLIEIQEASRIRDSGVLVGLNEFDRPGAVIPLMSGELARRHPDALCIITDNVGYGSCRPIDPSVLRRQGLIIDSDMLSKDALIARVRLNTGCTDKKLLSHAYALWECVRQYCAHNSITDGSVSPVELENFVQAVMFDGWDCLEDDLNDCIISKATSSYDDQRDIRTACQTTVKV